MTQLLGSARNVMMLANEGEVAAFVEVILLLSKPIYKYQPGGFAKSQEISDMRFMADVKGLRGLAKQLEEMAKEAEELEVLRTENDSPL